MCICVCNLILENQIRASNQDIEAPRSNLYMYIYKLYISKRPKQTLHCPLFAVTFLFSSTSISIANLNLYLGLQILALSLHQRIPHLHRRDERPCGQAHNVHTHHANLCSADGPGSCSKHDSPAHSYSGRKGCQKIDEKKKYWREMNT